MRAFISHSSKDKGFIEGVASLLKPGTFELDSQTFDAGLVNSKAITVALRRCDLFCLFLSASSVKSAYVDFETLLGLEFLARGQIERFLAICLDDEAFVQASSEVRFQFGSKGRQCRERRPTDSRPIGRRGISDSHLSASVHRPRSRDA
jgi:hypothetical protein